MNRLLTSVAVEHAEPMRKPVTSGSTRTASTQAVPQIVGNLAVQRLLGAGMIQAKLAVSRPGDVDEQEADRVAEQITSSHATPQHHCSGCASNAPCSKCASNHRIQAKTESGHTPHVDSKTSAQIISSGGQPLSDSTRAFFEPRFGYNFSNVRVHNYPSADVGTGLRAFTYGQNIAFAPGQYSPDNETGKKLLAHELTHVIQQAGGHHPDNGAPTIGRVDGRVQGDGGLTKQDIAMLRRWLEGSAAQPQPDSSRPLRLLPTTRPFSQLSEEDSAQLRRWITGSSTTQYPGSPSQPGRDLTTGPRDPDLYQTYECPVSCHQTPAEMREAARRRVAERRERERRAAWPGMHRAQHEEELRQQPGSLREDIQSSEMMAAQLRLELFDRALQRQASDAVPILRDGELSQAMRDNWASAQQATLVLDALLQAASEPISTEVTAPIARVYRRYFESLNTALAEQDRADQRMLERQLEQQSFGRRCPTGACHQPVQWSSPGFSGAQLLPPAVAPGSLDVFRSRPSSTITTRTYLTGVRVQRLTGAIARLLTATNPTSWRAVIDDFRWSTREVDSILRSRLSGDASSRDQLEQFDFVQQLFQRQQAFMAEHPDALKIQAIFYPKEEFTSRTDNQGATREIAKGIPWHFYLTRTPVADPNSRYVPTGYEWQLHDITAPRRDNRTVRTRYQVSQIEALARERGPWSHPQPITQIDPPRSLFAELNHRDFFPEGMLYWRYPLSGDPGELEMTAPTPFGEWLTRIGLAIAVVGSLIFAPFSTPMLLSVGLGTGLSIAGRVARLHEQEQHGVLTEGDMNRFYWDLSLDLVNALTLGLGRAVTVSVEAGNLVRAASVARAWFIVRRAQVLMDVVNVGVVTADFIQQYRAIENSNLTDEQKRSAKQRLTILALGSGALMIVALRSGISDLTRGRQLRLDVDPGNPSRIVGDLEAGAEAASHLSSRPQQRATVVERTRFRHPVTGEEHSFALWSDGRITRCSDPPCSEIAESIVGRLDALQPRVPADSPTQTQMQGLLARARQIREEAEQLAAGSARRLAAQRRRLMKDVRQLESEVAELERQFPQGQRAAEPDESGIPLTDLPTATRTQPLNLRRAAIAAGNEYASIDEPFENILVFMHGTERAAAQQIVSRQGQNLSETAGNFRGRFFAAYSIEDAELFAGRTAGKTPGGQPAIVGIAIPRNEYERLVRNRQVLPGNEFTINSPTGEIIRRSTQVIFEPGSLQSLRNAGFFFLIQ